MNWDRCEGRIDTGSSYCITTFEGCIARKVYKTFPMPTFQITCTWPLGRLSIGPCITSRHITLISRYAS